MQSRPSAPDKALPQSHFGQVTGRLPPTSARWVHSIEHTRVNSRERQGVEMEQIDRLAKLMRCLTYGEMLEFASALRKAARDREITAETLPTIIHRWASEHGK